MCFLCNNQEMNQEKIAEVEGVNPLTNMQKDFDQSYGTVNSHLGIYQAMGGATQMTRGAMAPKHFEFSNFFKHI